MIPAVLSCLFVLYLYRTLNSPDQPPSPNQPDWAGSHDPSPSARGGSTDIRAMSARLASLQARVDKLAGAPPKRTKS